MLTRQHLLDAGFGLFRDRGYEATTIAAIAEAAGMSRASFFRYFSSKQALALDLDAELWEDSLGRFAGGAGSDSPLRDLCAALIGTFATLTPGSTAFARTMEIWSLITAHPDLRAAYLLRDARWAEEFVPVLAARLGVDADADYRPRVWVGLLHAAKEAALETLNRSCPAGREVSAESVMRDVLVAANLMSAPDSTTPTFDRSVPGEG